MPELPEVETTLRGLVPYLKGQTIRAAKVRVKKLRQAVPKDFEKRLVGARVTSAERRAKYILLHLNSGDTVLVHLGMSGRLVKTAPDEKLAKHDHIILTTAKGEIRFNDARRFGVVLLHPTAKLNEHALLKNLGPEPLGKELTPTYLAKALSGKKCSIKAALLDQRVIAGLGNIYVSEALFHARILPTRAAGSLTKTKIGKLILVIRKVLQAAIKAGGSSLRDYVQADGLLGSFQNNFVVYDRAGSRCPGCTCQISKTGGIQRIVQQGRSTFFCATKQV